MLHISPWSCAEGLLPGAASVLRPHGRLVTYGPYNDRAAFPEAGGFTAPSNEAFHRSLLERNPEWGVRDIADLETVAARAGLRLAERVPMPANNFLLVWERA
jgi:hypothetical protein